MRVLFLQHHFIVSDIFRVDLILPYTEVGIALYTRHSVSQRGVWVSFGHPVSILDTLLYLSFTCKSIVSEQFGHPVSSVIYK